MKPDLNKMRKELNISDRRSKVLNSVTLLLLCSFVLVVLIATMSLVVIEHSEGIIFSNVLEETNESLSDRHLILFFVMVVTFVLDFLAVFLGRINPKKYIYVSYASADEKTAFKIAQTLDAQFRKLSKYRFEVMSKESIHYGDNIKNVVEGYIKQADIVIVLISSDYIHSKMCSEELNLSLDEKKKIIPISIDSCVYENDVGFDLNNIKTLSLQECKNDDEFEKQLLKLAKDLIRQRTD